MHSVELRNGSHDLARVGIYHFHAGAVRDIEAAVDRIEKGVIPASLTANLDLRDYLVAFGGPCRADCQNYGENFLHICRFFVFLFPPVGRGPPSLWGGAFSRPAPPRRFSAL